MFPATTSVVRCYIFPTLSKKMLARISAGRTESAKVWTHCRDLHLAARKDHTPWPKRGELQKAVKGFYALHSQSAQMVCHAFLANIETTASLRKQGNHKMKYPWRDKRYYPLLWPAQAIAVKDNHIILPMGRGRNSIVLPRPEGFVPGGCKLVWNGSANELHVTIEVAVSVAQATGVTATVGLGLRLHRCNSIFRVSGGREPLG